MKNSIKIEYTANDVIDFVREEYEKGVLASEVTKVLDYIENEHDCHLCFWDNISVAYEITCLNKD